jgi:hypothetical protein
MMNMYPRPGCIKPNELRRLTSAPREAEQSEFIEEFAWDRDQSGSQLEVVAGRGGSAYLSISFGRTPQSISKWQSRRAGTFLSALLLLDYSCLHEYNPSLAQCPWVSDSIGFGHVSFAMIAIHSTLSLKSQNLLSYRYI